MKEFSFGTKSRKKLDTCHPRLRRIATLALRRSPYDFTIIHGWRGRQVQNALVESGVSRAPWPTSRHNRSQDGSVPHPKKVSDALDFAPWVNGGIPWKETHIFAAIAGCFFAAAEELSFTLTWGGDWDTDGLTSDQTLLDWGHVQLEF